MIKSIKTMHTGHVGFGSRMPKGTEMRPYLKQLSEEDRGEYIDDFVKRIKEIYSVQKTAV